ncbi:DUF3139 domain-containing protein [Paenibacillus sp. Y412MC10]|uniref:DUF3139 domain-containing protein n=1 Tax=Geobacillus sp. (strain Y412MC10) TaxID=481743 RepID=UPI0011A83851|nr:DUF3139 domain-containing protein [Paenibacillus sp. Y412MC10]
MKKKVFFILSFITLLAVAIGLYSLQSFKNRMNEEVISYLVNEKGYSENDIYKVTTIISKAPLVSTTVIFNDDKGSRYFYRKENGKIYQYSRAPLHGVDDGHTEYKHAEQINPDNGKGTK